jgi:uncharacterized protein
MRNFKLFSKAIHLVRLPALFLINIYQKTISPDHGVFKGFFPNGYCRFNPTCSQYGYEVIKKKGLVLGLLFTAWRILRCNPWSQGGNDPVK